MVKSLSLVFGSNFLSAGLGLLISILVGNILTIEDYGRFYLITTTFYILTFLIDGGLSTSIPVFLSKYYQYDFPIVLKYLFGLAKNYFIYIFLFVVGSFLILYLNGELNVLAYTYVIVGSIIGAISKILNSILQGNKEWKKFSIVNISLNFFRVVGITLIILFTTYRNLNGILLLFLLSLCFQLSLINLLLTRIDNQFGQEFTIDSNAQQFLRNHYQSFFLITIITVLASRMDIIMGNFIVKKNEIGIYSMASNLAFVFPIITSSLIQILITQSKNLITILNFKLFYKLLTVNISLIVLNFFLSPILIKFIFDGKFDQSVNSFLILSSIHILSIIFSPLESQLIKESPQKILFLKLVQFIILLLVPLMFYSWGIEAVLFSVFVSRLYAWQFLIRINYDQILEKLLIKKKS